MAKAKKKRVLPQKFIKIILGAYSITPGEFERVEDVPEKNVYRSTLFQKSKEQRYWIEIAQEKDAFTHEPTGRILVTHSDSHGNITFTDIWEMPDVGGLVWRYRNPFNVPLSDRQIIADLQAEIERIKALYQKQIEAMGGTSGGTSTAGAADRAHGTQSQKIPTAIIETKGDGRKAQGKKGRPYETAKQREVAEEIRALLKAGFTDKEIMDKLKMSKATYYRRKQQIKGT